MSTRIIRAKRRPRKKSLGERTKAYTKNLLKCIENKESHQVSILKLLTPSPSLIVVFLFALEWEDGTWEGVITSSVMPWKFYS